MSYGLRFKSYIDIIFASTNKANRILFHSDGKKFYWYAGLVGGGFSACYALGLEDTSELGEGASGYIKAFNSFLAETPIYERVLSFLADSKMVIFDRDGSIKRLK